MKGVMIRNLKFLKSLKSFRTLGTLGTLRATLAGFVFLMGSFFNPVGVSAAPVSDYPIFVQSSPNYEPFFPADQLPSEFISGESRVLLEPEEPPTEEELDPPVPVGGAPVRDQYWLIVGCCLVYGLYLRRKFHRRDARPCVSTTNATFATNATTAILAANAINTPACDIRNIRNNRHRRGGFETYNRRGGIPTHSRKVKAFSLSRKGGLQTRPSQANYSQPSTTNKQFTKYQIHNTMKHLFYPLATILVALFMTMNLGAQVTIGSGATPESYSVLQLETTITKGGLRLPQLTVTERDELAGSGTFATDQQSKGLVIYNTTSNCFEYWNGSKWVSLCQGQANITFTDAGGDTVDPTQPPFSHEGEDRGPFTPHDTPECTTQNPAYTFVIITGEDYFRLEVTDPITGEFNVTMDPNPTAAVRFAIVRIINNCSSEYKDFLFTQYGDTEGCNTSTVPEIKSYNNGQDNIFAMCAGGSVNLYLYGLPEGTYIWTLSDKEVGQGNTYTATVPGRYVVYGDKIGCPNNAAKRITSDATVAPDPVQIIVVGNNGIACGPGGEVDLIITQPVTGTIQWYKNGVLQTAKAGLSAIKAGAGTWHAVVEDVGTCSSAPTEKIVITEDLVGTPITTPEMKINGSTSDYKLCRGGSVYLEVVDPQPTITYTWYMDNDQVGTGSALYAPLPSFPQVVLRLRATAPSACAGEALSLKTIEMTEAPNPPFISNSTNDMLCGGNATLIASGGDTYRWYKDGIAVPDQTTGTYTVHSTGSYEVTAISAYGCNSKKSTLKEIGLSDFATVDWVLHPAAVFTTETKTYSVNIDFPLGAVYTWTIVDGTTTATITNGQGTPTVTVYFPTAGNVTVRCNVHTYCGEALGSPISQLVNVTVECRDARITDYSSLTPSIKTGNTVSLRVNATGTPAPTYQWYKGTIGTGVEIGAGLGGTNSVYNVPSGETGEVGQLKYYCIVSIPGVGCSAEPATSPQFTITVSANPATLPAGVGSFAGKTCFDIATGNDNINSCGSITGRSVQKTVFANRTPQNGATAGPYSGVQVYTYTPTGTVSHVRFDYVEMGSASGLTIDSIVPFDANYATAENISTACRVTVYYKASLDNTLKNVTRTNALKVKLYAIYNNRPSYISTADDRRLELTASLQDCACCGAKTTAGGWMNFMCHNLGADESLDPFVWNNSAGSDNLINNGVPDAFINGQQTYKDIKGWLFQWGRQADGHQYRNSEVRNNTARVSLASYIAAETKPDYYVAYNSLAADWITEPLGSVTSRERWGATVDAISIPKRIYDPCPPGWKIPSMAHWNAIKSPANTWKMVAGGGWLIGDALFLPFTGTRNYASGVVGPLTAASYWSSFTGYSTGWFAQPLAITNKGVTFSAHSAFTWGQSVRCVEE